MKATTNQHLLKHREVNWDEELCEDEVHEDSTALKKAD